MNLRGRFTVALVGFSLILTAAGSVLAWRVTSRALEDELDEKLLTVAGAAADVGLVGGDLVNLRPGDEASGLWSAYHQRLAPLKEYVEIAYVFGRRGEALVTSEPADSIPIGVPLRFLPAYASEVELAWATGEATTPLFRGGDGRLYKYGFKRLDGSEAMLGVLARADFLDPLERLRRALFLGALLAVILAGVLAYVLAGGIVRPLERLSRAALRIQRGRWDRSVEEARGDEVGRLSRAMERMRLGILQRDEQLRLMLAQVAHEIRNPLGGLELFASAAMEADDPDERRRLLERVGTEVEGLNAIINDFLTFARPLEPQARMHDLREPLRLAAELAGLELRGEGCELVLTLPDEPLLGVADPDHVKRAILNLLKNAADAGTRVWLTAWWQGGEAVVSVVDDGPGISAELRDRVFEAFVTDKERGAGLGLAIVKRLAETNGARVAIGDPVESRAAGDPIPEGGNGAEFRVYFPGSEEFPT